MATAAIAGGIASIFVYVLVRLGHSIVVAANMLVPFLIVTKFLLYKYWVYRNQLPKWLEQPTYYLIIVFFGYCLFLGTQYLLIQVGATERYSLVVAAMLVGTIRFVLFRRLFSS
jgi:hypothetical protein